MTAERSRVAALVLAGGRSRRFGTDKLEAEVGGRPLLDAAVDAAVAASDAQVVVVGPVERALPAGVLVTREEPAYAGPFAAVAAGLELVDADVVLVLAGDLLDPAPAIPALLARTGRLTRTRMLRRSSTPTADGSRCSRPSGSCRCAAASRASTPTVAPRASSSTACTWSRCPTAARGRATSTRPTTCPPDLGAQTDGRTCVPVDGVVSNASRIACVAVTESVWKPTPSGTIAAPGHVCPPPCTVHSATVTPCRQPV